MAELLGVVAGGAGLVSLAIQLGENSTKIKRLYRSYKDAPNSLQDLSEDLETFALALNALDRDRQQHSGVESGIVERCVRICEREVSRIGIVVSKLEATIRKSNLKGRISTAFSQTDVSKLLDELERGKTSLLLAHQLYISSRQRSDNARIMERLECNTATVVQQIQWCATYESPGPDERMLAVNVVQQRATVEPIKQDSNGAMQKRRRTSHRRNKGQGRDQTWRLSFSPWFTNQLWEVSFNAAKSGFDFNLRTCNIISENAPIFRACRIGNFAKVQSLFKTGEASPYDCCYIARCGYSYGPQLIQGLNVLSFAAESGSVTLCRYLVEVGGLLPSPNGFQHPMQSYDLFQGVASRAEAQRFHMFSFLLKQSGLDLDTFDRNEIFSVGISLGGEDDACAKLLRDECAPEHSVSSWRWELTAAKRKSRRHHVDQMPKVFLQGLGQTALTSAIVHKSALLGTPILHVVAEESSRIRSGAAPPTWVDFIQQLLECGADLHQKDSRGYTALTALLSARWNIVLSSVLKSWIRLLQAAGVDLMAYGKVETTIRDASEDCFRYTGTASWTCGPQVFDWNAEWLEKTSIPVYERVIPPGAWVPDNAHTPGIICWAPDEQDSSDGPWEWVRVRRVTILSRPRSCAMLSDHYMKTDYVLSWMLRCTQDDCSALVRLIRNNSKPHLRKRSYSHTSRDIVRHILPEDIRHWLPYRIVSSHNGQVKFPLHIVASWDRACAEEFHEEHADDRCHEAIMREMLSFQERYHDRDSLRSLPYAAYHRSWSGHQSYAV